MSTTQGTDRTHARQVMDAGTQLHRLCIESAAHGAKAGGELGNPNTLQALHDAADLSLVLVNLLARASRLHRAQAEVSREAVEHCASVLRPLEKEDDQYRAAFAACRSFIKAVDMHTGSATTEDYTEQDEVVAETFPASDAAPPPTEV